jgi:YXWGXW repeat-containing protein
VKTLALTILLLMGILAMGVPTASAGGVIVSVSFAPPLLPVYEQPICPGDGYIWTPGYWAYDVDGGYYWVPGTWVLAPEVGFLWTPPYWGFVDGAFFFHEGYWGPHVGFYGGVVYGFGYFGHGFEGGRWDNGHFFYNRAVAHIDERVIHNVYNARVSERGEARVSYNGGAGGISARATAEEESAARERHIASSGEQGRHAEAARGNPEFRASANHGKPPIAATGRPGDFKGEGAVAAKKAGGPYHADESREAKSRGAEEKRPAESREAEKRATEEKRGAENREAASRATAVHPRDLPPVERPAKPNTGDAKVDQKYQQQQDKLRARQEQDRQNLQRKQDAEHEQLARQKADEAKQRQVEQKHQQQTEKMTQQHAAQAQKMQQRQQPPATHSASKPPSGGRPERP